MTGVLEQALAAWRAGMRAAHPAHHLAGLQRDATGWWRFCGEAILAPGPTTLLTMGKNAALLASALDRRGLQFADGLVLGSGESPHPWPQIRGGHPRPNAASLEAGEAVMALLDNLGPADRLLVLMSGGASSMVEAPADGWTLSDLGEARAKDLASGLGIAWVNRRAAARSRIKDGGLASRCAAPWAQLTVSDVGPGNPGLVSSGPFLGLIGDGPKLVSAADMAAGAAAHLRSLGWRVELGQALAGEASTTGKSLRLPSPGTARVFAGECSVTGPFAGRGGRNSELVGGWLGQRHPGRWAIVAGSADGLDGSSGGAGAFASHSDLQRLDRLEFAQKRHDLGPWFEERGLALKAGEETGHVGDLVVLLAAPEV